jgi:hypothetical protein
MYLGRAGKDIDTLDFTKIQAALSEDAQYLLPADMGVADLALMLKSDSLALTEDKFAKMDASKMTQKKIASEFTKAMVKAIANRKFIGVVIPVLA